MHVVPMGRVSAVTEYEARLNMTVEELNDAPLYQPPATDEQITFALQRALETDPRTREAGLRVEVQEGVVRFLGTMTNAVQDAATSIARRIRGVIGFTEDIVEPASRAAGKQRL
jgi:osmotically-inducible protein OsmY